LAPARLPAAAGAATGVPDDGSGVAGAAFDEFSLFEHATEKNMIPIRIVMLSRFISAGSASVGMHLMTYLRPSDVLGERWPDCADVLEHRPSERRMLDVAR
jgi:hypothetical protein